MTDHVITRTPDQTPVAETAVNEWRRIVTYQDWNGLGNLLADDVTYHNPAQWEPYRGKEALTGILTLVFGIFEDFEYLRRFRGPDGFVLEFKAQIGNHPLTGIDIVRFDEAGKLVDLVVMLRPADAVAQLGEEAARRMSPGSAPSA